MPLIGELNFWKPGGSRCTLVRKRTSNLFESPLFFQSNTSIVFNAALAVIGVLWLCKSDYVLGLAMEQLATKARFYPDRAIAVLSQLVPGDPVTERYRDIIQQLIELLNDPAGKIVTFI